MKLRQSHAKPHTKVMVIAIAVVLLAACVSVALDSPLPALARGPEQFDPVYLPLVFREYPWPSPFGVELYREIDAGLATRAEALGSQWVRLLRVSWRDIQPNEGDPYNWSVLASFDDEIRTLKGLGMTAVVIVQHSPRWATINIPFETDCGAIRTDKFGAFAAFMTALVQRYKQPEFDVHHWELGNEPDVDPSLVSVDSRFGCWGDIGDPYYGGEHYGEMLKVVTPAIKAVDPTAKVLVGGLLLATPETTDPNLGRPELFLQGILEAQAAPYFDILPYHAYPSYTGAAIDYDNQQPADWYALGGWTLGKARYLRDLMGQYGVTKPLHLNEMALGCNPSWYSCSPPPPEFFEAQANFIARTIVRDLSEDLRAIFWYTLDGPGWRSGGLLDGSNNPRPAYHAYQHLIARLAGSRFGEKLADYGGGVESYEFISRSRRIHVAWSIDMTPDVLLVPKSQFVAAYDRDGALVEPLDLGDSYQLTAGFSPVYIELYR